jgi:hypothetical protein
MAVNKRKPKGVLGQVGDAVAAGAEAVVDAGAKAVRAVGDLLPAGKAPPKGRKAPAKKAATKSAGRAAKSASPKAPKAGAKGPKAKAAGAKPKAGATAKKAASPKKATKRKG